MMIRKNFKKGHKDNAQFYNVPKHDGVHDMEHPNPLQDSIDEIQNFTKVGFLLAIVGTHADQVSRKSTRR